MTSRPTITAKCYLYGLLGSAGAGGVDLIDARIFSSSCATFFGAPAGALVVLLRETEGADYGEASRRMLETLEYESFPEPWISKLRYFLRFDLARGKGRAAWMRAAGFEYEEQPEPEPTPPVRVELTGVGDSLTDPADPDGITFKVGDEVMYGRRFQQLVELDMTHAWEDRGKIVALYPNGPLFGSRTAPCAQIEWYKPGTTEYLTTTYEDLTIIRHARTTQP